MRRWSPPMNQIPLALRNLATLAGSLAAARQATPGRGGPMGPIRALGAQQLDRGGGPGQAVVGVREDADAHVTRPGPRWGVPPASTARSWGYAPATRIHCTRHGRHRLGLPG